MTVTVLLAIAAVGGWTFFVLAMRGWTRALNELKALLRGES